MSDDKLTPKDLDAIAARAEAASPAPWCADVGVYEDPEGDEDMAFARGPMVHRSEGTPHPQWMRQAEVDAAFIVSARADVLPLVAEVRALRERVEPAALVEERDLLRAQWAAWYDRASEAQAERDAARQERDRLRTRCEALADRMSIRSDPYSRDYARAMRAALKETDGDETKGPTR